MGKGAKGKSAFEFIYTAILETGYRFAFWDAITVATATQ